MLSIFNLSDSAITSTTYVVNPIMLCYQKINPGQMTTDLAGDTAARNCQYGGLKLVTVMRSNQPAGTTSVK